MRIPEILLNSVAFLCIKKSEDNYDYKGTGFFLHVKSEKHPKEYYYVYFVTAKHCLKRAEFEGELWIRVNTPDDDVIYVSVQNEWQFPDDDAMDIAVVPLALPRDQCKYTCLHEDLILTDALIEKNDIGIGDNLIAIGLFT